MAQPIGVILQQWADLGIFFYVLPGLLIFALVYAILYKINIMGGSSPQENRGVYAIISIAIALLSLQFDVVPTFFQIIFPKLGVGLSIILTFIILGGLFVDLSKPSGGRLIFFTVAAVLAIIILLTSFNDYSWWTGSFWQENISAIIAGIIILVFIAIVVGAGSKEAVPLPQREYRQ
ncbi:MAG: hypothetical protein QW727_03660 [Candidatus Pacearchaeota archaeon]